MELTTNIELSWIKKDTDLSKCSCCDDVIYGNMYVLIYRMESGIVIEADMMLCESCKNL